MEKFMKYILVFLTVIVSILSSLILDFASEHYKTFSFILLVMFGIAFALNVLKFVIWGWIHKNFDVTKSYPLTAIFFPIIFIVAVIKREADLSISKTIGVVIILIGLFVFERRKEVVK